MVREHDGLGALQVRVPGQRRVDGFRGPRDEGFLHAPQPLVDARDYVLQIEAFVEGDLVVARAARVKLAGDVADQFLESPLDVHVDVFELGPERERTGRELAPDGLEAAHDRVALGGREEPGTAERLRPRDAARQVPGPEALVEGERSGEALRRRIGGAREAARPRLVLPDPPASGPGRHESSAAMSSMIRWVTLCRAVRRRCAPSGRKRRGGPKRTDRKSTRLNSSHTVISYAVFCLKKKRQE